jgi:anti-sigma regulatory factor (Ser/Thr protein kinase)
MSVDEHLTHFTSENFTPTLDAPRHVRELLRSQLRELHCDEQLIELGTLTASELAANAVLHAHTPFRLLIEQKDESVWIAVEDEEPVQGRFKIVSRPLHGLALISALAERWGVTPGAHGKVVWAELHH